MNNDAALQLSVPSALAGRDLLRISDLSRAELLGLLDLAAQLKRARAEGVPHELCKGRSLGMIFQKSSTRTRVSFEVGMTQLGGHALNLAASELQLGRGETIDDTGMVLSRFLDAIMIRTYAQDEIDELAAAASIPVINGLSDDHHPCQALADVLTLRERFGDDLRGVRVAYTGDGNNVCRSFLDAGALVGLELLVASPPGYEIDPPTARRTAQTAEQNGGSLTLTNDPQEVAAGSRALYTDTFISMGQELESAGRLRDLMPYRIDEERAAQLASDGVILHCLPAHHGQEIDREVLYGYRSAVWDQAENRLHAQKALLVAVLASPTA